MTESYAPRRGSFIVERPEGRARRRPRATPDVTRYIKHAHEEIAPLGAVIPLRRQTSISGAETLAHLAFIARETTDTRPSLAERFEELRDTWQEETAFFSTAMSRYMHPAYQQIIGMGSEALPLILRALRDTPDDWYWALAAISGQDAAEGAETPSEARERWLEWGQDQGHLGW